MSVSDGARCVGKLGQDYSVLSISTITMEVIYLSETLYLPTGPQHDAVNLKAHHSEAASLTMQLCGCLVPSGSVQQSLE
jgi:hypothetical protein